MICSRRPPNQIPAGRAHTSFTDWLADNDDAAGAANAEMVATAVLTTIETIE
jgi:hypothetical protein